MELKEVYEKIGGDYDDVVATGTENESAIAFLRSMGLLLLQNGFVKRILLPDVDVVKRMYLHYD